MIEPAEVLLIINPESGRGRALLLRPAILTAFRDAGYRIVEHLTVDLADAERAAREAKPGSIIASLGGDGLHGAVATGLAANGSKGNVTLLFLAGGRGNDAVRRLGLPLDPVTAIAEIPRLRRASLDLGTMNGKPFLNVASVGFDGLANEIANATRLNLGPLSYPYGALLAFFKWRKAKFTLTVDGQQQIFTGWMVAIGNLGQYGGGVRICPHAIADDGQLDALAVGPGGVLHMAVTLLKAFKGSHVPHPMNLELRGSSVQIAADWRMNVYVDGENAGPLPAEIGILPAAVSALVPLGSAALKR